MMHNCHTCANGDREKGICEVFAEGDDATQIAIADWIALVTRNDKVPVEADGCPCWRTMTVVIKNVAVAPLNGCEALLAFAEWIILLNVSIIARRKHDVVVWAQMIQQFVETNNLGNLRPGWEKLIVYPEKEVVG